jgi:hypothetical protein
VQNKAAQRLAVSPCSPAAVAVKCVLDQSFMAPLGCALFYVSQGLLAGKPDLIAPTMQVWPRLAPVLVAQTAWRSGMPGNT